VGEHNFETTSNVVAEAMVVSWELQETVRARYKFIEIEGDNKIVVDAVKGHIHAP